MNYKQYFSMNYYDRLKTFGYGKHKIELIQQDNKRKEWKLLNTITLGVLRKNLYLEAIF